MLWPAWPVALGSAPGLALAPEEDEAAGEAFEEADEEDCRPDPFELAERVCPPLAPGLGTLGLGKGCPLLKVLPPAAFLEGCLRFSSGVNPVEIGRAHV